MQFTLDKLVRGIRTHLLLSVFLISLGFVMIFSSIQLGLSIWCTEFVLPPKLATIVERLDILLPSNESDKG